MYNLIKTSFRSGFPAILCFIIVILIWGMVSWLSSWNAQVFPNPVTVASSLWELLANGELLKHTIASLFRITVGFYLAMLCGIPLGMILGRRKVLQNALNPLIQFMRPISPLAWIPLAMLWFGIGDQPAIFLIFLASFFPLVVSTTLAVNAINPTFFQVATNFNLTRFEVVTKIILPAMLPAVLTALRITLGIAWLVVVAAEMIAVDSGLGYLVLDSRNALRMDYVMASMVVIGLIGLGLDQLMARVSRTDGVLWGSLSR